MTKFKVLAQFSRQLGCLRREEHGVAALEFALILPLMLLMYFGSAELTKGILVNRKVTIAARSLSDLLAQKPNAITDADATQIFNAAIAVMGTDSAGLKMTLSSIKFVLKTNSTTQYDAKTMWSVTGSGNSLRACGVLTPDNSTALAPDITKVPSGFYTGGGTIVVADVTYTYPSPFNISTPFYSSPGTLTFQRAYFNTPRILTSLAYSGSNATQCP